MFSSPAKQLCEGFPGSQSDRNSPRVKGELEIRASLGEPRVWGPCRGHRKDNLLCGGHHGNLDGVPMKEGALLLLSVGGRVPALKPTS